VRIRLTARETGLLCVLLIIAVISAYFMLFYLPITREIDTIENSSMVLREQLDASVKRAEKRDSMVKELNQIFENNEEPVGLAEYDNIKQVMFELNSILSDTLDYSLSFGTVDTDSDIIRRSISINFSSNSYDSAKNILHRLNESAYRCMLDDINISISENQITSVNGTIVFFEYK